MTKNSQLAEVARATKVRKGRKLKIADGNPYALQEVACAQHDYVTEAVHVTSANGAVTVADMTAVQMYDDLKAMIM